VIACVQPQELDELRGHKRLMIAPDGAITPG
jgi:hypothetical protein